VTGAGWRVQLSSYAMKPRSRGRVRLSSVDPSVAAEIEPGFLSDPDGADLAVVVDGIERVRRIAAAPAIAAAVEGEALPGPAASTRADLESYVRENVRSYFHATGTCRAGRADDGAVVDPAGRVHGLEGLYVADASTLPSTPRANTHLTTLAIAELIADGLKEIDR
jgi:choline dehydrogenase